MTEAQARAWQSIQGLSVGDGFGERAFASPQFVWERTLPEGPWRWTDDTAMAWSIWETLCAHGTVDQDELAHRFAQRFLAEPNRGYGYGAVQLMEKVLAGAPWAEEAPALFRGTGSYGNGAAMRVAPLGAWFAGDTERVIDEARRSAEVTHAHLEGQESAVAVAVTTSWLASDASSRGAALLRDVAAVLAPSETRSRIEAAAELAPNEVETATRQLGSGQQIAGFDTAPFCVWVAAHRGRDWADALFTTAQGFGDVDTTCAIVGGMVAIPSGGPPQDWLERREPLPQSPTVQD